MKEEEVLYRDLYQITLTHGDFEKKYMGSREYLTLKMKETWKAWHPETPYPYSDNIEDIQPDDFFVTWNKWERFNPPAYQYRLKEFFSAIKKICDEYEKYVQ